MQFNYKKLKACRERKGLTQTELMFELDKVGLRVTRQTIIKWESGVTSPTANNLPILAKFLGKLPSYFFDDGEGK